MGHGHWWVSKLKVGANGKHVKHETILMARAFGKVKGFEYEDIFALVIKWGTPKSLVALVVQLIQMENFTPKCIKKF
jgi:hypothetical protein